MTLALIESQWADRSTLTPGFESTHRQFFISNISLTVDCLTDENNVKEAGIAHLKKWHIYTPKKSIFLYLTKTRGYRCQFWTSEFTNSLQSVWTCIVHRHWKCQTKGICLDNNKRHLVSKKFQIFLRNWSRLLATFSYLRCGCLGMARWYGRSTSNTVSNKLVTSKDSKEGK